MKYFGFFKGMVLTRDKTESFNQFENYKNTINKEKVIKYMKGILPALYTCKQQAKDIFNGELINEGQVGVIIDGDYEYPWDFVYYYENYDIGIPYEYEEYLKTKI